MAPASLAADYYSYDTGSTSWPYSVVGKLFLTDPSGASWLCSGTAVASSNQSTVDTAGHCVYNAINKFWYGNWMFCPVYNNGNCPLGQWIARNVYTRTEWQNHQYEFDLGELIMWYNGQGPLTSIVGGAGVAWNQDWNQNWTAAGYPGSNPVMHVCLSDTKGEENPDGVLGISPPDTHSIHCNTSGGTSGGPWFIGFDTGWVRVNGHFSYQHNGDSITEWSPYYGNAAMDLYNWASTH